MKHAFPKNPFISNALMNSKNLKVNNNDRSLKNIAISTPYIREDEWSFNPTLTF